MKFLVFDFVLFLCFMQVLCQDSTQLSMDRSLDVTTQPTVTEKQISKNDNFVCPNKDTRILFFSLPCGTNSDCQIFGSKMVCCSKKCLQGIPRKEEQKVQSTPKEKLATERNDSVERSNDLPTKIVIQSVTTSPVVKDIGLVCPHDARIPFFSLLCTTDNDCSASGEKMVCCKNRCIKGVHSQKHVVQETVTKKLEIKREDIKDRPSNRPIVQAPHENVTDLKIISKNITLNNLVCPEKGVRIPFFSLSCVTDGDCSKSNKDMVCCSNRCIKGVLPRKPDIVHSPSWFGLVERNCPVDAIVEILEVRECETDADCRPRICCPDKYRSGGNKSYCRTPQPSLQRFPLADRATEPLRVFASYIQCTPPPPPIFDLFPKSCNNALDCFPNLCCQEGDKKYCRPPKRSVLQLVAGLGQRFIPPDAAKKLIERLN
ncbi:uncharacterized protein LOC123686061 isoform X2 [Harmonia axyridis]|uniref:uncharacterized protein LOC123686061 isoform X2 n=1 Tax=Harmonia axyridis TaxID=115357 RepID=UPI001E278522|nr:uncharacterized protein LOC123686061 isoform X2 [Harmonia axyridis]